MASGLRDAGVTLTARIVSLVIMLASQSALAWMLGASGRGSYAVCMVFAMVLRIFASVGCGVASPYFIASGRLTLSEGTSNTLVYMVLSSLVGIGVGLALTVLPLPFLAKAQWGSFVLALGMIPSLIAYEVVAQILTAIRRFTAYAVFTTVLPVLQLVLILILPGLLGWGVNGALLAVICAAALTTALILAYLRLRCALTWVRPSASQLGMMFRFGLRYYLGKLSNLANTKVGTIILAFFATSEDIGLFALAMALVGAVEMIPDTLSIVLLPRVAEDKTGRPELTAQAARLLALICGTALLVLAVLADVVIAILFPPEFAPAAILVRILCVGMVVRCASKVLVPYLIARDHPGLASLSVAAGVGVNLAVLWTLLPRIGVSASALAVTLSYLVSSTVLQIAFSHVSGMGLIATWRIRKADFAAFAPLWRRIRGGRKSSAPES